MANLSNINGKFVVEQTTGYVGVGTTDPNYPIEVLNASAEIALNASGGSIYRLRSTSGDSFMITKNGVGDRLVIDGSGNSTFSGNVITTGTSFIGKASTSSYVPDDGVFGGIITNGGGFKIQTAAVDTLTLSAVGGNMTIRGEGTFGGNVNIQGNLTLSVASSFINTAAGDLYINPASNNTTLYDGANAQIFNVYDAGALAIKLNAGTGGGVLLARDGINFESGYSGNGLVLSHHGIGPSNAIVSGNSVYPDNLFINSGGAANDWSNVTIYGNVGIGTDLPGRKLEIKDEITTNGHIQGLRIMGNASNYYDIGRMVSGPLSIQGSQAGYNDIVLAPTSGDVGIGTTSPDSKLDVKGASATPADGNQTLSITNTTGGTQLNIGTAENSYGWIEAREGATLRNLLLNPNGGNVGIGTSSPGYPLEINSSVGGGGMLSVMSTSTEASISHRVSSGGANTGWVTGNASNNYFIWSYTKGSQVMTFLPSGNVGIGTTSPGAELQVVGRVKTTRIVSSNIILGNIRSNVVGTAYMLLVDLNVTAGFSLAGKVNAASYTTWNVSDIYVRKNYNATTGYATITGISKSGSTLSVVDISHSSGRFIALKLTGDPEVDVMWAGYRLDALFQGSGEVTTLTSGVTENSVYASY